MKWRQWVVLLLAGCTIGFRGLGIYQALDASTVVPRGFVHHIRDGYLTVGLIPERDLWGEHHWMATVGLREGDRVVAVASADGSSRQVESYGDFYGALAQVHRDEAWTLVVSRETEPRSWADVRVAVPAATSVTESFEERAFTIAMGALFPLIAIVTAVFIGLARPDDPGAFLASLLFFAFQSIFSGRAAEYGLFDARRVFVLVHAVLGSLLGYLFMRFFLIFPAPSPIERRAPWLKHAGLVIAVATAAVSVVAMTAGWISFAWRTWLADTFHSNGIERAFTFLSLGMVLIGLVSLISHIVAADTRDERRRLVILLYGALGGLLPLLALVGYAVTLGRPPLWTIAVVLLLMQLFPLSFMYVVIRHRVLGVRLILRRGLQYAVVSRGFIAVEALLLFVVFFGIMEPFLTRVFESPGVEAAGTAFAALGVVLATRSVNRRVMPAIDRRFFREAYDARQVLLDLSRSVRRLAGQPEVLAQRVVDTVSDAMLADQVALFVRGTVPRRPGPVPAPARLAAWPDDEFRCPLRKIRSVKGSAKDEKAKDGSILLLPVASVVGAKLQKSVSDPEVIDIDLADLDGWAEPLANPSTDEARVERRWLEALNTQLVVPLVSRERVEGFLSLGAKLSEEAYTSEDKELLLSVSEQVALALENGRLIADAAEQEKLKRELEIAREVQSRLFPQTLPPMRTLDYAAECRPARRVGGDYYDFLALGPDTLGIALGDISGKGISAALLMASLQALLRSQAAARTGSVADLVADINRHLAESTDASKYATFVYGVYDDERRTFCYVNAGHCPPLLFRPRGGGASGTAMAPGHAIDVSTLDRGGPVIGLLPEVAYQQDAVQLQPGDVLVVYSDGISEAADARDEEFGEDGLVDLVRSNFGLAAAALRDLILQRVEEFATGVPQRDDQTLIVAKVR